ncbi:hypothetical protein TKK_0013969 [Trichogramma kaykai]|uniref:Peptidase S1 domain-containing protein n=1 Tax=Trichogramma kaykai TaxID=54128 RepID=A0ABD2WF87_9HYME
MNLSLVIFIAQIFYLILLNYKVDAIVGGESDNTNAHSYQVALLIRRNKDSKFRSRCGGVIISDHHILTAAHCIILRDGTKRKLRNIVVYVGSNRLDGRGKRYVIKNIFIKKRFSYQPWNNDLAVIQLEEKLNSEQDKSISKALLPDTKTENYDGKLTVASGFGIFKYETVVDENNHISKVPKFAGIRQYIYVPVVDCNKNNPKYICVGANKYNKVVQEITEGDSGGPLIYDHKVIGIIGQSDKMTTLREKPAFLTRVSYFLRFIQESMKKVNYEKPSGIHEL